MPKTHFKNTTTTIRVIMTWKNSMRFFIKLGEKIQVACHYTYRVKQNVINVHCATIQGETEDTLYKVFTFAIDFLVRTVTMEHRVQSFITTYTVEAWFVPTLKLYSTSFWNKITKFMFHLKSYVLESFSWSYLFYIYLFIKTQNK